MDLLILHLKYFLQFFLLYQFKKIQVRCLELYYLFMLSCHFTQHILLLKSQYCFINDLLVFIYFLIQNFSTFTRFKIIHEKINTKNLFHIFRIQIKICIKILLYHEKNSRDCFNNHQLNYICTVFHPKTQAQNYEEMCILFLFCISLLYDIHKVQFFISN